MHIVSIVLIYGFLAGLIWWLPSYLQYGSVGRLPWATRLTVIRDQLLIVIGLSAASKTLLAFELTFFGKLLAGALTAAAVYFVWEDIVNWSDPKPLKTTREIGAVIVGILMIASVIYHLV